MIPQFRLEATPTAEYAKLCSRIRNWLPFKDSVPHYTTYAAAKHVVENRIPGDLVECGVGNGIMPVLWCAFLQRRAVQRTVYLYDTFAGMTEPNPTRDFKLDNSLSGPAALQKYRAAATANGSNWCCYSEATVRSNIQPTRYPANCVQFIAGDVRQTIPFRNRHKQIAVLRLDTDWYELTLLELEFLYPKLVPGGLLLVDDYGSWAGQQQALHDYFNQQPHKPTTMLYTCRKERVFIKEEYED